MSSLTHSMNAYQLIRDRIIAFEGTIDEATLSDTLEGLTDLHEVIAAIIRSALFDEALAEGLKVHLQALQERLNRINDRARERRRVARDAMVEVDIRKITAPDFSASMRPGNPALLVFDEPAIPTQYWEPREPRLDRLGLLNDLKRGLLVAGATMSKPEPVIAVRVR